MQRRLSVTCRLNASFREALQGSRFSVEGDHLYDKKHNQTIYPTRGSTNCCGIEELDFQTLNPDLWESYRKPDSVWYELIAKYILASCEGVNDERVVFVGVPVRVGSGSMYNIDFYEKLLVTLKEFGFRELCRPYKNNNSKNTITVLAGQMLK